MLTMQIHPHDLSDPSLWDTTPTGWATNTSRLTPYQHPCLEHGFTRTDGRAFLVSRERARGRTTCYSTSPVTEYTGPSEYQRRLAEARTWPLGYLIVEFTPGQVRLTASPWGTAPLHLTTAGGTLCGSWDLLDLIPYVNPRRFDPLSVVRFLTYANYYSSSTLLDDVVTLTERASATYTGAGAHIAYPEPGLHALPRELAQNADPVATFEAVLHEVVNRWEFDASQAVADVSGGMDSTNVALALAQLHPEQIETGAMLLPGTLGEQQRHRRGEFLARGFSADHTVEMLDHLPFAPHGRRRVGLPFDPGEGPYAEARDVLLTGYASQGKRVLFTGLGGDEAMKLRSAERERLGLTGRSPLHQRNGEPAFLGPRGRDLLPYRFEGSAPLGPTLWSILDCFSAFYPQHMRHGIWPINPFAAPEIVRLCESLPAEWRTNKHLLRSRLTRAGFSRETANPQRHETFQEVLDTAMRRHGAALLSETLDNGSFLVEDGYLDEVELRYTAQRFAATGERTFDVYRPLILETGLTSFQAGWKGRPVQIRPARARDRDGVEEMVARRVRWMDERGLAAPADVARDIAAQVGEPDSPMWVLLDDGAVVGTTSAYGQCPAWAFTDAERAVPALFLASTWTVPNGRRLGWELARWALGHAARTGRSQVRRGTFSAQLVRYYTRVQGWEVVRSVERRGRTCTFLTRPAEEEPGPAGRGERTGATDAWTR